MSRLLDLTVAGLGLLLAAPLLAVAAIAIRLETSGSPIYRQRRRLEVKPGITGWAQVHGRASLPWDERIELDVWYVDNRSFRLDLRILARTVRMLATGHGLYKGETGGWRPTA